MLVKNLLENKSKSVYSIEPEVPVLAAIHLLAEKSIGSVLVMLDGELKGILSERDYARKVILMGRSSASTMVWQIMTSPVITVTPDDTLSHCMELMTDKRIRHLPVLENNQVIGVLSIGDLVKAVIEQQRLEIEQLQQYIAG